MDSAASSPADRAGGAGVAPVATLSIGPAPATTAAPVVQRTHGGGGAFGLATFASLRHRDFRYLWFGTFFMTSGMWVQQVTLGWLVYELTGSAVLLGTLNAVRALPFLLCSPFAGVAADRFDRRRLLLATQPLLLASALVMGALIGLGQLEVWHLFGFTALTALVWAFNTPVRQALVPSLVPRRELLNAISLNSVGFNTTKVLGPALGGALIVWFGAAGNFFVQAVAYACVLVWLYLMRVPAGASPTHRGGSALADLKEGLAYVWRHPVLLGLMVMALVPNIFVMPVYQALMPIFQKDVVGVGPDGLGLLLAAPGAGATVATLALASVAHRVRRPGLLLLGCLVLMGVFLYLFSRTSELGSGALMLVGMGAFQITFLTTNNTMIQLAVPDALRGRVMAIYGIDHGLAPAGAMLAGLEAHFLGAPTTVAISGAAVVLLGLLIAWRMPRIRQMKA